MSSPNYNLNALTEGQPKSSTWSALRKLANMLPEERGTLILALITMIGYAVLSMLPPALIGYTLDHIIDAEQNNEGLHFLGLTFLRGNGFSLILTVCSWLLVIYLLNLAAVYLRTVLMGGCASRTYGASSKPTTLICSGMETPASAHAS